MVREAQRTFREGHHPVASVVADNGNQANYSPTVSLAGEHRTNFNHSYSGVFWASALGLKD